MSAPPNKERDKDHDPIAGEAHPSRPGAKANLVTRRRLMIKVLATVGVLGAAVAVLLYSTLSSGAAYYLHVDELMKNPTAWQDKELQIHGRVKPGSIHRTPEGVTVHYTFVEQWNDAAITVNFDGVVPDTFKDNAEVVAKGRLAPDGTFTADDLTAKCPSRYQGST
jgi:cytochrome c-type biogenesis protein CcmE